MSDLRLTIDPMGILPSPEEMSDEITEAAAWFKRYRALPGWLSLETRAWVQAHRDEFRQRIRQVQRPSHHGLAAALARHSSATAPTSRSTAG